MYLITYVCKKYPQEVYVLGYSFEKSVEGFIESTQKYEDETYYVLNAQEVSDDFTAKYEGNLKGE